MSTMYFEPLTGVKQVDRVGQKTLSTWTEFVKHKKRKSWVAFAVNTFNQQYSFSRWATPPKDNHNMNALQALQEELSTIPALIEESIRRRDTGAVRRLQARQAELPDDIASAELSDLEAQMVALDERAKAQGKNAQALNASLDAARLAHAKATEALLLAQEAIQQDFLAHMSLQSERNALQRQLGVATATQEAALSGKPLHLTEFQLGEWNREQRRRVVAETEKV